MKGRNRDINIFSISATGFVCVSNGCIYFIDRRFVSILSQKFRDYGLYVSHTSGA